jgi:hypothetical protein
MGIYARTIALADEDEELINALRQEWYAFVTPTTPVSRHLLEDIIFSDIMNERTKRALQQAIADQGLSALASWNEQRRLVAESWAAALGTHTLEASHALRSHSHGCLLLIERYEGLAAELRRWGRLTWPQCESLCLLSGFPAEGGDPLAVELRYLYRLWNAGCQVVDGEEVVAHLLRPENRPETLRGLPAEEFYPDDAAECRAGLLREVARQVAFLHGEVAQHRLEKENAEVARLLEPLASLQDDAASRRFSRCQAECRTLFHRSWAALKKELAGDEPARPGSGTAPSEPEPSEAEGVSPVPPDGAAEGVAVVAEAPGVAAPAAREEGAGIGSENEPTWGLGSKQGNKMSPN